MAGISIMWSMGKCFDDVERMGCIVRTLHALKHRKSLIVKCFERCGLLSGYRDVSRHFPPNLFNSGLSLRDSNLPRVTKSYVRTILSIRNLSQARYAPVLIPESMLSEQQRLISEYLREDAAFRKFYFSIGLSARTEVS